MIYLTSANCITLIAGPCYITTNLLMKNKIRENLKNEQLRYKQIINYKYKEIIKAKNGKV